MSKFIEDAFLSRNVENILVRDEFRIFFQNWTDIRDIKNPMESISYTSTAQTGEGATVTSGHADVSVMGMKTLKQRVDFLKLENALILNEPELIQVGSENEQSVISDMKAIQYGQYSDLFFDWYIGGGSIAARDGEGLVNPYALLSMESPACKNVVTAKPTDYTEWLTLFRSNINEMRMNGNLSGQLVVLIDPMLLTELSDLTPLDASVNLLDRLDRNYGFVYRPLMRLTGTGKMLIMDPMIQSVSFIVGKDPEYLTMRDGTVRSDWESYKMGNQAINQYVSHTQAVIGNVIVKEPKSMLAIQVQ